MIYDPSLHANFDLIPLFPLQEFIFLHGSFNLSLFIDEYLNFDSFNQDFSTSRSVSP